MLDGARSCERNQKLVNGKIYVGGAPMSIERVYKSAWHLLIAAVGVYELRNHKTKLSKVLACGLIAFHADAAICDALNIPTTPQRILAGIALREGR